MSQQPYPDEQTWWPNVAYPAFDELYREVGRHWPDEHDPLCFVWPQRVAWDIRDGMTAEASLAKHLRDLEAALHPPTPIPTPPPGTSQIVGQLRVQGNVFRDDAGLVLPMFCHFGEAFSAYTRRPDDVRQQLAVIASAGYQGIRFWDVLGYHDQNRPGSPPWTAWAGKEVTPVGFTAYSGRVIPPTPQYYEQLAGFLSDCRAVGLVVQHSRGDLNAFTWEQIQHHAARVGDVQRSVGLTTIAVNEACNESWQNGVPEPAKLQTIIARIGNAPVLCGSSAADDGYGGELPASVDTYTVAIGMSTHIVHGYRGGESLNRIGHIHALGYETLPARNLTAWQGEPAGPGDGVSVGKEDHPEALCLMAAMALATRQGWVYMSGAGVFWNAPIESMTAFREVARVPGLLPLDIMTWAKIIHGGSSWRGQRVLVAHDGSGPGPIYRADHILHADGHQFVCLIYGPEDSYRVPVERSFVGEIITPTTGERHAFSGTAGQSVDIAFARGRIIIGHTI